MERKVSHYAIESADRPTFGVTSIPLFLIADSHRRDWIKKKVYEEEHPEMVKAEEGWEEILKELKPLSDHDWQNKYRKSPLEIRPEEIETRDLRPDEITIKRASIQAKMRSDAFKLQVHKAGFPTYKVRLIGAGAGGNTPMTCDVCRREDAQIVVMDMLRRKK